MLDQEITFVNAWIALLLSVVLEIHFVLEMGLAEYVLEDTETYKVIDKRFKGILKDVTFSMVSCSLEDDFCGTKWNMVIFWMKDW